MWHAGDQKEKNHRADTDEESPQSGPAASDTTQKVKGGDL